MSKLGTLVAIPLGLYAIKQLQKQFPDEKDPKPVVEEGFTLGPAGGSGMDIAPLFPEGLQLTTTIPGGAAKATGPTTRLGMDTDVVPFFPESSITAAEEFAAKKPFEFGLFPKIDLSQIQPGQFTSGLFDPEFQAGLRK